MLSNLDNLDQTIQKCKFSVFFVFLDNSLTVRMLGSKGVISKTYEPKGCKVRKDKINEQCTRMDRYDPEWTSVMLSR